MTLLYERAVSIAARLEAAAAADASESLLVQGQVLVTALQEATAELTAAAALRKTLAVDSSPPLDLKLITSTTGALRAGLARHGAAAFQHVPATNVKDAVKAQRAAAQRWAGKVWRDWFDREALNFTQATADRLQGKPELRRPAQELQQRLRRMRELNPLTESDVLHREAGSAMPGEWLTHVADLDARLGRALEALDAAREEQPPAVRDALARAGTVAGLPISALTDELLQAIRAAGVSDQLVVRRS